MSGIEGLSHLARVVGSRLIRVERQLFRPDFDYYGEDSRDEESDGPIQFTTDRGWVFYVAGNTECMSVGVFAGPMPILGSTYFPREIGRNQFWTPRLDKPVISVHALVSNLQHAHAAPFGLEFPLGQPSRSQSNTSVMTVTLIRLG